MDDTLPPFPEVSEEVKKWLAVRKEAGLQIDPETAEVTWTHAQTLDPYGVCPKLPPEYDQIGREYFARAPGSDIWVSFGDIPPEKRHRLWEKYKASPSFPTGFFSDLPAEFRRHLEELLRGRVVDPELVHNWPDLPLPDL